MERRNDVTAWGSGEKRAREAYAEDHPNAFKHFKRSESSFVLGIKYHLVSKLQVLSSTRQPSRLGAESAAAWHSPRGLPGAICLSSTRSCGGIQCYCSLGYHHSLREWAAALDLTPRTEWTEVHCVPFPSPSLLITSAF